MFGAHLAWHLSHERNNNIQNNCLELHFPEPNSSPLQNRSGPNRKVVFQPLILLRVDAHQQRTLQTELPCCVDGVVCEAMSRTCHLVAAKKSWNLKGPLSHFLEEYIYPPKNESISQQKERKRKTHRLKTAGESRGICDYSQEGILFFKRYVRFVEGNLKSIAWGWFVECFIFICFMKLRKFSATKWVLGGRCSSLLPPSLCRWLWCYSPLPCALIWMNKFNKTQTECDKSQITFSSWEYTASFSVHVTNYFTLHYMALHCIRLHCITWYYITSHCTTLHYITLNNTLHPDYIKSDHITWHAICIISHSRYTVHLKDPRSESSRRAW